MSGVGLLRESRSRLFTPLSRFSGREPAIRFLVDVAPVFVRSTRPGVTDAPALDLDRLEFECYRVLQDGHTGGVD
jgi:hypothetical protein